jgi:hypothetical protein
MHINASYDFPDDYKYIYRTIIWGCSCYTAYFFKDTVLYEKFRTSAYCTQHSPVKVI